MCHALRLVPPSDPPSHTWGWMDGPLAPCLPDAGPGLALENQ